MSRTTTREVLHHAVGTSSSTIVNIRVATMADVPVLERLITASVRGLNAGRAEMDAALAGVFGVDTQLIADGTYYVMDGPAGPAAVGGWSGRRTLYGGDKMKGVRGSTPGPSHGACAHPRFLRASRLVATRTRATTVRRV